MNDENNFESQVVNGVAIATEVAPEEIAESMSGELGRKVPQQIQRALASWAEDNRSDRRTRGLFQADKYVTPSGVYNQMQVAYDALDDDVVGNVADVSEAMAFQKVTFETANEKDQENIWHQIGRDIDLDSFVRTMWRELYTTSVCYPVKWWGKKTYTVKEMREERKGSLRW